LVDLSPPAFLDLIENPQPNQFYYYSTNINPIGALQGDLVSETTWFEVDPRSQQQNINFWMGQQGTIADTHYDAYYNFFIQVR
jgi:hypothetical protein